MKLGRKYLIMKANWIEHFNTASQTELESSKQDTLTMEVKISNALEVMEKCTENGIMVNLWLSISGKC